MLTSPDLKGGHIEVIPYFTQLSVYEIHNGWYKISYNGHIGWVDSAYTSFLSKNASGVLTIDMPHNENLVARMSPVNSSKVIFSIPNSTCVAVKRYVRDWSEINYQGQTGWVPTEYTIGIEGDYTQKPFYTLGDTPIRSLPSLNAKVIGTLQKGEAVNSYDGCRDSQGTFWSNIIANGVNGWVPSKSLIKQNY